MVAIERGIDALSEKVGRWTALLALPLIAVIVFEVLMRYAFNAPTQWAFEVTNFLFGVHFLLGFAYTLKHKGHVAVDVFESHLRPGLRVRLRILTGVLFLVPTGLVFAVGSIRYAADSWAVWERNSTSWAPALYPYKTLMAFGFVLLLLQGVSALLADLRRVGAEKAPATPAVVPSMPGGAP